MSYDREISDSDPADANSPGGFCRYVRADAAGRFPGKGFPIRGIPGYLLAALAFVMSFNTLFAADFLGAQARRREVSAWPLLHLERDEDDSVKSLALLCLYWMGREKDARLDALVPMFMYRRSDFDEAGRPERVNFLSLPNVYYQRDRTKSTVHVAPYLFTRSTDRAADTVHTRVTPLFERSEDPEKVAVGFLYPLGRAEWGKNTGAGSFRFLPLVYHRHDRAYSNDVVFPLWWRKRSPEQHVDLVLPFYFGIGSDIAADGKPRNRLAMTLPNVIVKTEAGHSRVHVAPYLFDYRASERDDSRRVMVTPFFFRETETSGATTGFLYPLGKYESLNGERRGYDFRMFPLIFMGRSARETADTREEDKNFRLLTFALSRSTGKRSDEDTFDRRTAALFPLFSCSTDEPGAYDGKAFLGLAGRWRSNDETGGTWMFPFFCDVKNKYGWEFPTELFLAGRSRANDSGEKSIWLHPLFYRTTDTGGNTWMHTGLLAGCSRNETAGTVRRWALPFFWSRHDRNFSGLNVLGAGNFFRETDRAGNLKRRHASVFPLFWDSEDREKRLTFAPFVPLYLAADRKNAAGGNSRSLRLYTPLVGSRVEGDAVARWAAPAFFYRKNGDLTRLNVMLLANYAHDAATGGKHFSIMPLFLHERDKESVRTLTPFFYHAASPEKRRLWIAPWFYGKSDARGNDLLNLWPVYTGEKKMRGTTAKTARSVMYPLVQWKNDERTNDRSVMALPFFRSGRKTDANKTVTERFDTPLTWYSRKQYTDGDTSACFATPLFAADSTSNKKSAWVFPWFYRAVKKSGDCDNFLWPFYTYSRTVRASGCLERHGIIDPLFSWHRSKDVNGAVTSGRIFTPVYARSYRGAATSQWFFPTIATSTDGEKRQSMALPIFYNSSSPRASVRWVFPTYYSSRDASAATTSCLPFFRFSEEKQDGAVKKTGWCGPAYWCRTIENGEVKNAADGVLPFIFVTRATAPTDDADPSFRPYTETLLPFMLSRFRTYDAAGSDGADREIDALWPFFSWRTGRSLRILPLVSWRKDEHFVSPGYVSVTGRSRRQFVAVPPLLTVGVRRGLDTPWMFSPLLMTYYSNEGGVKTFRVAWEFVKYGYEPADDFTDLAVRPLFRVKRNARGFDVKILQGIFHRQSGVDGYSYWSALFGLLRRERKPGQTPDYSYLWLF